MSHHQAGPVQWLWSTHYQQRYFHDPHRNQYVFENGLTIDVPRPTITPANQPRQQPTSDGPAFQMNNNTPRIRPNVSPSNFTDATYGSYTTQPRERPSSWNSSGSESLTDPSTLKLEALRFESRPQRRVQRVSFGPVTEMFDANINVRTTLPSEPRGDITDRGVLEESGLVRMLRSTPNAEETLDKRFRMRDKPSRFFVPGRMFLTLWAEPAGDANQSGVSVPSMISNTMIGSGLFGEPVFQKVRRFIVVREGYQCCTALPVGTYGGRGVSKYVKKSDHAIIYSGRTPPLPLDQEKPGRGEEAMRPLAIRVVPDEKTEKLDPMSRINFAKPHTIQHYVKVRPFGMVEEKSKNHLLSQFRAVLLDESSTRGQPGILRNAPSRNKGPKSFHLTTARDTFGGESSESVHQQPAQHDSLATSYGESSGDEDLSEDDSDEDVDAM